MIQGDYWKNELREEHNTMEKYLLLENFKVLEKYQVPLTTITKITGIKFKEQLYDTNPLFLQNNAVTEEKNIKVSETYIIHGPLDLILDRELN